MAYEPKNFDSLLGIEGFSDTMLKNHVTLYQCYVTNTNKLADALTLMTKGGKTPTPEYSELKRRFGWEFNGMRLHELYFENLVKGGKPLQALGESGSNSKLSNQFATDFGSYEIWEKDFRATGAMRGIGWVILYFDPHASQEKRLFNVWVNEHDAGHLSGAIPLLVMDVFEHAFMLDYGLKRADYINSFFKGLDWSTVEKRLG